MNIIGIIPARYDSSRFPGKALADINGKSMIQRVYERALSAKCLSTVYVATDDSRIADEVDKFGGNTVMTCPSHQSGTDRCREVVERKGIDCDVVINIQGDEPYIHPEQIEGVAKCFDEKDTQIATLVKEITSTEELFDVNTPKVILNKEGEATAFSREVIPVLDVADKSKWLEHETFFKHIGIYAYRKEVLMAISMLKQSPMELAERLEQLRWLENGYKIKAKVTTYESISVDTPADLERLISSLKPQ